MMIDPLRQVEQVIAEMTDALSSGAFFNPEMFGAMLKGSDNPILRWRDSLLAALQPLPVPDQGWRDIETAPKDGTPVLACRAIWVAPSILVYLNGPALIEGWHSYEVSPQGRKPHNPTHWMPLPDPPVERER